MDAIRFAKRSSWTFIPTDAEGHHANLVGGVLTLVFTSVSVVVLSLFLLIWRRRDLRHHLKHTSTQLLYACVAVTIPQGLGYASTCLGIGKHELAFCRLGMTLSVFGYNAANCLQGCICINLVLAIKWTQATQYNIAPWYYFFSFLFSIILAIVPLCFNQYQWSVTNHSCWLKDTGADFNTWQLAILEIPLVIVTVLMIISTIVVTRYVLKSRAEGKAHADVVNQLFEPTFNPGLETLNIQSDTNMNDRFEIEEVSISENFYPSLGTPVGKSPPRPTKPKRSPIPGVNSIIPNAFLQRLSTSYPASPASAAWNSPIWSPQNSSAVLGALPVPSPANSGESPDTHPLKIRVARMPVSAHFGNNPLDEDAKKIRRLLFRVASFPVMHLIISIFGVLGYLGLESAEHSRRSTQVALYILTFIGTAWIPLAYSICAVLADTSLWDVYRDLRHRSKGSNDEDLEVALGRNKHRVSQVTSDGQVEVRVQSDTNKAINTWITINRRGSSVTSLSSDDIEMDLEPGSNLDPDALGIVLSENSDRRRSTHERLEQVVEEDEQTPSP